MSDLGLELLAFARDIMQLDEEWTRSEPRGFTWWGARLAQRAWAEPVRQEVGTEICRLHARSDLVCELELDTRRSQVLGALAAFLPLSALVVGEGRLQLATSLYVHRDGVEWAKRHFAFSLALQAAQAHELLERLPALLEARPDESAHPDSGPRGEPDEMLGLIGGLVRPAGEGPSRWSLDDAREAFEEVLGPLGIQPREQEGFLWTPYPWRGEEATLIVNPSVSPPSFGSGALVRLALPVSAGAELERALALNARELGEHTRASLMGSWYPDGDRLQHDTFLPNASHLEGLLGHMLFGMALRMRWSERALEETRP